MDPFLNLSFASSNDTNVISNDTTEFEHADRRPNESQVFIGVVGTLFVLWIVIFNALLITSILLNKKIRKEVFYLLVCNTALTFLLIGVLVIPFGVLHFVHGYWLFSRCLCLAYVFMDVFFFASVVIGLLMASLERLLFILSPTLLKGQIVFFTVALISVPWIIGLLIILPVALQSDNQYMASSDCAYKFETEFIYAVYIVTFFIPALSILFLDAIAVVLQLRYRRPSHVVSKEQSRDQSNTLFSIVALTVVDVVLLSLMFLLYVLFIAGAACVDAGNCHIILNPRLWQLAIFLCYIAPGFSQIGWLIDPQIRRSIVNLICCRLCRKRKEPVHEHFATPETNRELAAVPISDDHDKRVKHYIDDSIASSEEDVSESAENASQTLNTPKKKKVPTATLR